MKALCVSMVGFGRDLGLAVVATGITLTALSSVGCASSLAAPFDTLKKDQAPMTVFKLQNYEPPAAAATSAAAGAVSGIPAQIQSWITAGAQLLPAGLIPPGLLPGTTAPAATAQAARFHDFRILGSVNIADSHVHDDIMNILGDASNFEAPKESCLYAEFGVAVSQINQQPADILISLSCSQVRAFNFVWPHGNNTGLKADTIKKISAAMTKAFGG